MKNKTTSDAKHEKGGEPPSQLIDARIKKLGDWRGETLARVRKIIRQADPEVVEEVKWRKPSNGMLGVPVWEHNGIICTGETYKAVVKLTFAQGASLEDPAGLFNSSLDGNVRRAIDIGEGDKINEKALQALIRAAVALNTSRPVAGRRPPQKKRKVTADVRRACPAHCGSRLLVECRSGQPECLIVVLEARGRGNGEPPGSWSGGSPLLLPEHRRSSRSRSGVSLEDRQLADQWLPMALAGQGAVWPNNHCGSVLELKFHSMIIDRGIT